MEIANLKIGPRGSIRLPLLFRKKIGLKSEDHISIILKDDYTIEIKKFSDTLSAARQWVKQYDTQPEKSLHTELEEMRKAEFNNENN